jgi:hypothetical protein
MNMRKWVSFAVMTSLSGAALAQSRPCVPEADARQIMLTALPDVVTGLADRCRPHLTEDAFLLSFAPAFAERAQPAADLAWPKARPALVKLAGSQGKIFDAMPDAAVRPLFSTMVATGLGDQIKDEQCALLDRLMEAIAPLPAQNFAEIGITLALLAQSSTKPQEQKPGALRMCPPDKSIPVPVNRPTITYGTK